MKFYPFKYCDFKLSIFDGSCRDKEGRWFLCTCANNGDIFQIPYSFSESSKHLAGGVDTVFCVEFCRASFSYGDFNSIQL